MPRPSIQTLGAAVALGLASCGGTEGPEPEAGGCHRAEGGEVTLVAADLRWDTDCLQAVPGPLTIVVDNQDNGENHNVHLPDAPGSPANQLAPGPSRDELDVTLVAGAYEFICDLHPNMVGTLTVADANRP